MQVGLLLFIFSILSLFLPLSTHGNSFFDFYIIPLARKLKDCGVFGVSSAEYLRYAEQNRKEWEVRGQEVVAGFIAKFNASSESDGHLSSQNGTN
mmetsp:Transcript_8911/g.16174  ORF Transcript_8911/g.16174 Transcript_8911/m.16174 type:complete len:95 (-) Transcript_8911:1128-1412(-)